MTDDGDDGGSDRREHARFDVSIEVDYQDGETFLFSYIQNISMMGIFVRSDAPLPIGTRMDLRFHHEGHQLSLHGEVMWVNPYRTDGDNLNPGMGVRFVDLTAEDRERLVSLVRTIAYLQDEEPSN
jgi:type IV pilus assembly protein PilZ